ncbi:Cathepsin_B [Hexamita inflata]|uniref:Cathepsin B n=1 Tax=Hexamita inflata TaxID=28002 RepID=A0AA86TRL4_9EUKA|nr:Cathepsin B [Hexamita inflata]
MFAILCLQHNTLNSHLEILKNIPGLTWTPGISKYLLNKDQDELDYLFTPKQLNPQKLNLPTHDTQIPYTELEPIDWSELKPECVNVFRDMGYCQTSETFALISLMSDQRCIQKRDPVRISYSEQYLINCNNYQNGCERSTTYMVPTYLINYGTTFENCTSFKSGSTGKKMQCARICDDNITQLKLNKIINSTQMRVKDKVYSMKQSLKSAPISAQFILYEDFMFYTGGIYQHSYGKLLSYHSCEIVGHGQENGVAYWKVKFYFGPDFGENGYIKFIMGQNECGIEDYPLFIKV